MRSILVLFAALLSFCQSPRLSLAAEQYQTATETALTTDSTFSDSTQGSYGDQSEYFYPLSIEEEGATDAEALRLQQEFQEALKAAQESKAAEKYQKKKNALIFASLSLLIPLVLSLVVHELLVYPKAKEIYNSEEGHNLSEEQIYDMILEDLPSSLAIDFISFLTVFLVANFAYRVALVAIPKFKPWKKKQELAREREEQQTEEETEAAASAAPAGVY